MSRIMNFASPVLFPLAFAIVLPFVVSSPTLAGSVLVYAVAAMACNLLLGYGGLLSFCQGTFFGLGGYLFGLALLRGHCGILTALVVAIVGCGLIAGLIGAVAIRRKGLYFVMLTLAFAQLFYFIAYSLPALTGGDNGMEGLPRLPTLLPFLKGLPVADSVALYILIAIAFIAAYGLLLRVIGSPFGSVLIAIRENEHRVGPLGYNVRHYKTLAFVLSGALTGLAGAIDGLLLGMVPLSNIDIGTSQNILIAAILGGAGSLSGSVFGAAALVIASDFLSDLWPRWQMVLGVLLVLLVIFAPDGLSGLWRRLVSRVRRQTYDRKDKQWTTF